MELELKKRTRRAAVSAALAFVLIYLLTNKFTYSCIRFDNQNSILQGCTTGEQKRMVFLSLWLFALIGYLIYEFSRIIRIEIIDET